MLLSGCNSELAAAKVLGYTQVSWDGKEAPKPPAHNTTFYALTHEERMAVVVLGYTGKAWDNDSGKEQQPASKDKFWADLTTCSGEHTLTLDGAHILSLLLSHARWSTILDNQRTHSHSHKNAKANKLLREC